MGFLDSFERSVERAVGGSFAKAFASGVHPVEIVAALKRETDARAKIVSRTRTLAPHRFHVKLSPIDWERLHGLGDAFVGELSQAVSDYASTRGYQFSDAVVVALTAVSSLSEGMVEVTSEATARVVWVPTLSWKSIRYVLTQESTVLGRGTDTDIHVVAPGVSRHHAQVRWNGKRAEIVDLGSTNGTTLEGKKVSRAALPERCTLGLGQARILFEVVPQAEDAYNALAQHKLASAEETL